MPLLKEEAFEDDGNLVIKKTWDLNPHIERADAIRGNFKRGEMYHVGSVPFAVLDMWLREAGVSWQDNEAKAEVIKKKLNDGEFARLRNWGGRW